MKCLIDSPRFCGKPSWVAWFGALLLLLLIARQSYAQTPTTLFNFDGTDGANPSGALAISGSTLYGTTLYGGTAQDSRGTVFTINTDGTGFQDLISFAGVGSNSFDPFGGVTLSGSTLYGMTENGGPVQNGLYYGTVYRINTDGSGFQQLLTFSGSNGANPDGNLTLSGTSLYGMTPTDGANNYGTVFSVNTDGSGFQNLLKFSGTNGANPFGDSLIISGSTLFGLAQQGGDNNDGTVFRIKTDGSGFQTVLSFNGTNGQYPSGNLSLSASTLYGMTQYGGDNDDGTIFKINTDGTGFQNLLSFSGTNGAIPTSSLILSGQTIFGTTQEGGVNNDGTVFSVNTDGSCFQDLLSFSGTNGANPDGILTLSGQTL